MKELEQLIRFAYKCDLDYVHEDVVNKMKLILLDSIGAIIFGNQTKEVRKLAQETQTSGGEYILGTPYMATPPMAALVNAQGMVSQELDEGNLYAKGHPSSYVLPALLPFANQYDCAGKDFLLSLLVGYEITTRLGYGIKLKSAVHPHGNFGIAGGSVAVSKLLGFNYKQMEHAMSLAVSLPIATLWENAFYGHRVRDVYMGLANQINMIIPDLVRAGYTGSLNSFSSIYKQILGHDVNADNISKKLGEEYFLMYNYFKRYPYCRYTHSPLEAFQKMSQKVDFNPEKIKRINVYTYQVASQLDKQEVDNDFAVKFSIPATIADWVYSQNSKISKKEMGKRIFVYHDPEIDRELPNERNSKVEIIMEDESIHTHYQVGAKGDPQDPFSEIEIKDKFIALTEPIIGKSASNQIIDICLSIEKRCVRELITHCKTNL